MIRVFGPIGTEVHNEGRRYEMVALMEGIATWRTKCEACAAPFFVETRGGYVPAAKRCPEHKGKKLGLPAPAEVSDEEAGIIQSRFPPGTMQIGQFLPISASHVSEPAFTPEPSAEIKPALRTALLAARAAIRGHQMPAGVTPLSGFVRAHIGDEDGPTVTMTVGDERIAKKIESEHSDLYAELAEFGEDDDLVPEIRERTAAEIWIPRLRLWVGKKMWLEASWGPPPGKQGCLVPEEFMRR